MENSITEQQVRSIIQEEYDKNTFDTNSNFISRFAKAVHEKLVPTETENPNQLKFEL